MHYTHKHPDRHRIQDDCPLVSHSVSPGQWSCWPARAREGSQPVAGSPSSRSCGNTPWSPVNTSHAVLTHNITGGLIISQYINFILSFTTRYEMIWKYITFVSSSKIMHFIFSSEGVFNMRLCIWFKLCMLSSMSLRTLKLQYSGPQTMAQGPNFSISLTLFIPDVRPEIIPMLPEQLGKKTDMENKFTWCVSNLIFSATT